MVKVRHKTYIMLYRGIIHSKCFLGSLSFIEIFKTLTLIFQNYDFLSPCNYVNILYICTCIYILYICKCPTYHLYSQKAVNHNVISIVLLKYIIIIFEQITKYGCTEQFTLSIGAFSSWPEHSLGKERSIRETKTNGSRLLPQP